MASTSDTDEHIELMTRGSELQRSLPIKWTAAAAAAFLFLTVLAAGCGGSKSPGPSGGGSGASVLARFEAYAGCMRSHGIQDFPDPTTSPGGGVAFQIDGGPGSDLDHNDPRYQQADKACRGLLPGGGQVQAPLSAQRIAAEVGWARCMRSHGLPAFPDPDSQGAFDSSKFDESSPAFQIAGNACVSLRPAGPTPAVPGRG